MIPASSVRATPAFLPAQVRRTQKPGMMLTQAGSGSNYEIDATITPISGETLESTFARLKATLAEFDAIPTHLFIFGSTGIFSNCEIAMRSQFKEVQWPVTWAEGKSAGAEGLAGIQVFAVSPRHVDVIEERGNVIATVFENGPTRHCLIGGLGYEHPGETKAIQARKALERLHQTLNAQGFDFGDIVRTWFYLDDILGWYNDFNKVRTAFYQPYQFRVGSLPASTGVSARNQFGTALSAAAWASRPLDGACTVREVISPLQCPAACYGSSFSRAVEMDLPQGRRVLISGTASIEPGGKTVWTDDIARQVNLTMEVVDAILKSRGMSFADTSRATAYFKSPDFRFAFEDWCHKHSQNFPTTIPIHCDICRDDLLFELELDAIK